MFTSSLRFTGRSMLRPYGVWAYRVLRDFAKTAWNGATGAPIITHLRSEDPFLRQGKPELHERQEQDAGL